MARGLGVDAEHVASPTYVIVHHYPTGPSGHERGIGTLAHVDAYRLHGDDELETVGWDRVIDEAQGCAAHGTVAVIEWAARIPSCVQSLLPTEVASVRMDGERAYGPDDRANADTRRLEFRVPEAWLLSTDAQRRCDAEHFLSAAMEAGASLPSDWARCPTTRRAVSPRNPSFPFADEKARMSDLGKWLTGAYTVSRELREEDLDDPDLRAPSGT